MKHFPLSIVVFVCVARCLALGPQLRAEDRPPNIILMFTDDQAISCLGAMGNEAIRTPNMDALARRGVLFENAFVTTAICCSNRACLLTGQHMYRHGITDFQKPLGAEAFSHTYPALLRKAGYRTGYLGKYAIGSPTADQRKLSLPADQFDYWYGFPQSINFRQVVNGKPQYLTEVMTEKAIEFLRTSSSDKPFCLTVAFKEPHGPFNYFDPSVPNVYANKKLPESPTFTENDFASQPAFIRNSLNGDGTRSRLESPERYQEDLRTVYRTVTRADQAVGKIMDELHHLKLDDNTVVIFTSDHGCLLGDHGLFGKWLMYENSIRVPLIVYDPRLDAKLAGSRRDEMALTIDIAPTILSIAGIEPPKSMQGVDIMPILQGTHTDWRSQFYYEHTYQTDPPRAPIAESEGIRTTRWKFIRYPKQTPVYEQLFDLERDPLEQNNLADEESQAEILARLRLLCQQRGLE